MFKNSADTRITRTRRNANYTAISNAIINHPDLSPLAAYALIYLLSKPDNWELQISDLRRQCRCGRNKVYEILRELKESRFVQAQDVISKGRFSRVEYLVFDEPGERQLIAPCAEKGHASPCAEIRDTEKGHSNKERNKETTESLLLSAGAFDEWWAVYPHKVAKPTAKKAFEKAIRKAPLVSLIAGVRDYVSGKPVDRPYCNPATWLNDERWLDQPSKVTKPTGVAPARDALFAICQTEMFNTIGGE